MDGVVDGWLTATMSQQGCNISKEVAESCLGPESLGDSRSAPLGSLKVWKLPLKSMWSFWLTTFFHGTKRRTVLHLHAWQCTMSCSKECLYILGCFGHKRRETYGVAPILPWPQPYWEPLEHLQAKDLWGWEAVHIQTAALGGYSDILQRNSSRNSQVQWMQELWSCCQIRGLMLKYYLTC